MPSIELSPRHFAEHVVVPVVPAESHDSSVTLKTLCGITIHIETSLPEVQEEFSQPGSLMVSELVEQLQVNAPYLTKAQIVANDEADGVLPAFVGIQIDQTIFQMYEDYQLYRFIEKQVRWQLFLFLAAETTNFIPNLHSSDQVQGLTITIPWNNLNSQLEHIIFYYEHIFFEYEQELQEWFLVQLDVAQQAGFGTLLYIEILEKLVSTYPDLVERMIEFFSRTSGKTFILTGIFGGNYRYMALDQ